MFRKRVAVGCAIVAVGLELCISANLLTWAGLPYVNEGGALPLKFHPGTDLVAVAFLFMLAAHPLSLIATPDRALLVFLMAIAGCALSSFVLTGPDNVIVLLDTFLPAGLLAIVLRRSTGKSLRGLRLLMQALFVSNAVLALAETAAQTTLIPLYLNEGEYQPHQEDFRPTALFDHPLTGALMMMMALSLAPQRGWMRLPYLSVVWAALIAFGGRMAIGVAVLSVVLAVVLRTAWLILARDQKAGQRVLLALGGLTVGGVMFITALWAGLGDRLAGHLYWDNSAQVRLAQWDILGQLDTSNFLLGMPRRELLANLNVLRLATGVGVVENFWLLMFISLGAFGFTIFVLAMASLALWFWQNAGAKGRILFITVMIVASTSNSLGRKSTVLVCLVATFVSVHSRRPLTNVIAPGGAATLTAQPA